MTTTYTLELDDVSLVYDVAGPLPTADGRPLLFAIGQPMDASGFRALAAELPGRTVVTYDPRGLGRSVRHDGRNENDPVVQAADLHALIGALGQGPVEVFASSGGAVAGLALVTAHPGDVSTLVAHEPPLAHLLPDADAARRAFETVDRAYAERGWGAGMAAFMTLISWQGEFTDEYFARPPADPAMFGMPTEDDGSRDDILLGDRSAAVGRYDPDVDALRASPVRIVPAHGEESQDTMPGRGAAALGARIGRDVVLFPSHHGGFSGPDEGWPGQAPAFARRLEEVLAG